MPVKRSMGYDWRNPSITARAAITQYSVMKKSACTLIKTHVALKHIQKPVTAIFMHTAYDLLL